MLSISHAYEERSEWSRRSFLTWTILFFADIVTTKNLSLHQFDIEEQKMICIKLKILTLQIWVEDTVFEILKWINWQHFLKTITSLTNKIEHSQIYNLQKSFEVSQYGIIWY
ncbi:hypothetical protein WUBG_15447 [Wuchereria bancrofti]|uniref:Uncharacterized protein n=1 Tax=Wuchereria bancrofti TaxID=6293 RepID=J9DVB5_WUCBA|nr:hypothetical protein WUBG_15447 [Wuchereria bancrofti]